MNTTLTCSIPLTLEERIHLREIELGTTRRRLVEAALLLYVGLPADLLGHMAQHAEAEGVSEAEYLTKLAMADLGLKRDGDVLMPIKAAKVTAATEETPGDDKPAKQTKSAKKKSAKKKSAKK